MEFEKRDKGIGSLDNLEHKKNNFSTKVWNQMG